LILHILQVAAGGAGKRDRRLRNARLSREVPPAYRLSAVRATALAAYAGGLQLA
jgi:hypothetical protein